MPIDTTTILMQLLKALSASWFVLPVLIIGIVWLIRSSWFKGLIGEFKVNLALKLGLSGGKYLLLKNVTLPTEDGSTQIDHIVVSQFGVFVIETKNYTGWIFGTTEQIKWTQKIHKRHSAAFQNPLRQNYKHTMTLAELLDLPDAKLFSMVVFTGDCTFKTDMPENVMHVSGLLHHMRSKTELMFTPQEVRSICDAIQSSRFEESWRTSVRHSRHVNEIVERGGSKQGGRRSGSKMSGGRREDNAPNDSGKICRRCGSPMALRPSTRNVGEQFWGCSTFPKCRATEENEIGGRTDGQQSSGRRSAHKDGGAPNDSGKVCRRCGSPMALRPSTRNVGEQFWGCSTFPKCRATEENEVVGGTDGQQSSDRRSAHKDGGAPNDSGKICPRCGSPMALRPSTRNVGENFWGCSTFPQCRATEECT